MCSSDLEGETDGEALREVEGEADGDALGEAAGDGLVDEDGDALGDEVGDGDAVGVPVPGQVWESLIPESDPSIIAYELPWMMRSRSEVGV